MTNLVSKRAYHLTRDMAELMYSYFVNSGGITDRMYLNHVEHKVPALYLLLDKKNHVYFGEFPTFNREGVTSAQAGYHVFKEPSFFYYHLKGMSMSGMTKADITSQFYLGMNKLLQEARRKNEKQAATKDEGTPKVAEEPHPQAQLDHLKANLAAGKYPTLHEKAEVKRQIVELTNQLNGTQPLSAAEKKAKLAADAAASKAKAIELRNQPSYQLPEGMGRYRVNSYVPNGQTAYRGARPERVSANENSGTAFYGQGIYTTTNKAYAAQFGNVKVMPLSTLPIRPLSLSAQTDFTQLEHLFCQENGIQRQHLALVGDMSTIIAKMGFDGVTIGHRTDMIIVKYML